KRTRLAHPIRTAVQSIRRCGIGTHAPALPRHSSATHVVRGRNIPCAPTTAPSEPAGLNNTLHAVSTTPTGVHTTTGRDHDYRSYENDGYRRDRSPCELTSPTISSRQDAPKSGNETGHTT